MSADAPSFPTLIRIYAEVLAMVAAATLLGILMMPAWGSGPIDLLYLVPVLAAASLFGLRPALFGAVASTLAYNFFFTAPIHTLRVSRPSDLVTVLILFVVAIVTSQLAARMRSQARIAAANAARNATIAGLARRLLSCSTPEDIGRVACGEIASLFDCNAVLLEEGGAQPRVVAQEPRGTQLTPSDIAAAAYVLDCGEPAGRGALRGDPAEWLFHPVKAETRVLAALGLARDDGATVVAGDRLPLLANLLDQAALALERSTLEAEVRDVERLRERDRLRGALLSSVGHDLRTPLTAVAAAAAELRRAPAQDRDGFISTIETEAGKLGRYIANLLDMARIEAGAVKLSEEPLDLVDAVSAATGDLRHSLAGRPLLVSLPADLPLVRTDPQLLHHMLLNILDNARRYSAAGTPIAVAGFREPSGVGLSVTNEGPGLAQPDALNAFAQLAGTDRKVGAGLGFAIVTGFAGAMGIKVSAMNRDGGVVMRLHFPWRLVVGQPSEAQVE